MAPSAISDKPKVLAFTYPECAGEEYMKEFKAKFQFDVLEATTREEVIRKVPEKVASSGPYDALLIRMGTKPYEPFDAELLQGLLPGCKIMVSGSAGYNEFDVDWMTKNGVIFCNTRNAVSEATADMAIFLMLAVLKDATRAENSARTGKWRHDHSPTVDPSGLTLGIIGMGSIGKHLAHKAAVFNMKVQYYNRNQLSAKEESRYGAAYCARLNELLSTSDVISVNCPLNDATTKMISHEQFAKMKDGVFFVNTARGPIVDEDALIEAMETGKVRRAGLDVFEEEPEIKQYFIDSDRCTLQPHLGGLTNASWQRAELECLENIRSFLETGKAISPVNENEV
ncbi:glycerate-and formate-dehydrogenase [Xylona heveae TC161]|uniref:Glycerate-and formate-dehydrogenase n=1 Tax=Xylona heveae (strain CBS 132557 / TC161) TaxID=1328760 RepID=A0A165HUB0_XYLHT|nr:glycerate-and formate-dehydrogenase [Xylona heveae TC161]KZF23933.1 glycerate-and formate-dehydrogenase [Xylona heveae TC161]